MHKPVADARGNGAPADCGISARTQQRLSTRGVRSVASPVLSRACLRAHAAPSETGRSPPGTRGRVLLGRAPPPTMARARPSSVACGPRATTMLDDSPDMVASNDRRRHLHRVGLGPRTRGTLGDAGLPRAQRRHLRSHRSRHGHRREAGWRQLIVTSAATTGGPRSASRSSRRSRNTSTTCP